MDVVLIQNPIGSGYFTQNVSPMDTMYADVNPAKIIIEHVSDAHDFHFFNINEKPVTIPLPVILYNKEKGFSCFMSSAFHHGHEAHDGYMLYTEHFAKEHHLEDRAGDSTVPRKINATGRLRGKPLFF